MPGRIAKHADMRSVTRAAPMGPVRFISRMREPQRAASSVAEVPRRRRSSMERARVRSAKKGDGERWRSV